MSMTLMLMLTDRDHNDTCSRVHDLCFNVGMTGTTRISVHMFMTFMLMLTDRDHKISVHMSMTFMLMLTDRVHKDICSHVHGIYAYSD